MNISKSEERKRPGFSFGHFWNSVSQTTTVMVVLALEERVRMIFWSRLYKINFNLNMI